MKPNFFLKLLLVTFVGMLFLNACTAKVDRSAAAAGVTPSATPSEAEAVFTLQTILNKGKMAYLGVGGEINGVVNPDLIVRPGATIRLILLNGDGMQHDVSLPDFDARSDYVSRLGDQAEINFVTDDRQPGSYPYFCTVPGHRQAGQEGRLVIAGP